MNRNTDDTNYIEDTYYNCGGLGEELFSVRPIYKLNVSDMPIKEFNKIQTYLKDENISYIYRYTTILKPPRRVNDVLCELLFLDSSVPTLISLMFDISPIKNLMDE